MTYRQKASSSGFPRIQVRAESGPLEILISSVFAKLCEGQEIDYTFNNFGVDADMHDSSRRCTFSLFSNNLPLDYGHEGKWYKEKCEKTKGSF